MPLSSAAFKTLLRLFIAVVDRPDEVGIITLHITRMLTCVMPSFLKRAKSAFKVESVSVQALPLDM